MPRLPINTGSAINAGDGEAIRDAFIKVNSMMEEVYSLLVSNGLDADFLTDGGVQNAKLSNMAPNTVKANLSGVAATPSDASVASLGAALGITSFPVFRRDIINGEFSVWQRGTSFTAAGYTADRWRMDLSGGAVTTTRQAFAAGDALGGIEPEFFLRQAVSGQSAAGHFACIEQRIESARTFAGGPVTFSFWARRSAGSGNIAVEFIQSFGTGGTPTGDVTSLGVTSVAITGAWVRYTVTATLPSNAGRSFGTNNNDYLAVRIWTSAGSTFNARSNSLGTQAVTVDLWGARIDVGTVASNLVALPREITLAQCHRFYARSLLLEYISVPAPAATFATSANVFYPQHMRAVPQLAFQDQVTSAITSFTTHRNHERGFVVIAVANSNTNATASWNWTADAEL